MTRLLTVLLLAGCTPATETVRLSNTGAAAWEGCPGRTSTPPFSDPALLSPAPAALSPWAEDFESYAVGTVECASHKASVLHLDVTAGCLGAVRKGAANQYGRGVVLGDVFRVVTTTAWTSQANRVRVWHDAPSAAINWPGIKLFTRYQTEDDLYVGGFLADGRAQVKRKLCGTYVTLAETPWPFPGGGSWHTYEFEADGALLTLRLDGAAVLQASDPVLTWGAAGIRVDSYNGAYLDDWAVR